MFTCLLKVVAQVNMSLLFHPRCLRNPKLPMQTVPYRIAKIASGPLLPPFLPCLEYDVCPLGNLTLMVPVARLQLKFLLHPTGHSDIT